LGAVFSAPLHLVAISELAFACGDTHIGSFSWVYLGSIGGVLGLVHVLIYQYMYLQKPLFDHFARSRNNYY
jgi:hypothetical protein